MSGMTQRKAEKLVELPLPEDPRSTKTFSLPFLGVRGALRCTFAVDNSALALFLLLLPWALLGAALWYGRFGPCDCSCPPAAAPPAAHGVTTSELAAAEPLPEPRIPLSRLPTCNETLNGASSSGGVPFVAAHTNGVCNGLPPKGFVPFTRILCASTSMKKGHFFGHMFAEYLDPMRLQQQEINMLEIGLKWGQSVKLWLDALPAGRIYGLEYRADFVQRISNSDRVRIFQGDQANVTRLHELADVVRREVGSLDFIIDDGGHTMVQQITSFTHLFELLRPGGVYFIEDLQTSYWKHFGGGLPGKKGTAIGLMKSLVDVVNNDFVDDHPGAGVGQPFATIGSGTYSVNPADKYVGSVQCWRNMCAIRRKFEDSHF